MFRSGASERREKLTTAPAAAQAAATARAVWVLCAGAMRNSSAMRAAPDVWPSTRAVASMPLALPLRAGGADAISTLLLGDWKRANPVPQSISRQTMSAAEGAPGSRASAASPAAMAARPAPPSTPAWTRPTSMPAVGAAIMMTAGQAVRISPVRTSSQPHSCWRKNGSATMASIWAV